MTQMLQPEGRIPPNSLQAEQAVLGAVLLENAVWKSVQYAVNPDDFYYEGNRRIFLAMATLAEAGTAIDAVTLGVQLTKDGDLERIGGAAALANLTDMAAMGTTVQQHCKIVVDKAAVRRMIYAAQEVVARGYMDAEDTVEYLGTSRTSIIQAARYADLSRGGPRPLDEDYKNIFSDLEQGVPPPGLIKTGIANIDKVSGGVWPGELVLVGARPGMGKTCFVQNIGMNAALMGRKVCYITLEDTRESVAIRNLARFSGIDNERIRLNQVRKEEYESKLMAFPTITNKPFHVEDTSSLSANQIAQIAAQEYDRYGLDLLIIDLLTEIDTGAGDNETVKITNAARVVRNIAKDMHIPIIMVHQLNAEVEKMPDKRPGLSHLRQSRELEAIARAVWFLFRPAYYLRVGDAEFEDRDYRRDAELIIAKKNHGRTGVVRLYMDLRVMYTRAWEYQQDGPWPGDVELYRVPDHFRDPPRLQDPSTQERSFGDRDY